MMPPSPGGHHRHLEIEDDFTSTNLSKFTWRDVIIATVYDAGLKRQPGSAGGRSGETDGANASDKC